MFPTSRRGQLRANKGVNAARIYKIVEISNYELVAILDQKGVIQNCLHGTKYDDQAKKVYVLINNDSLCFDKYKLKNPNISIASLGTYIKQYFGNDSKFDNPKKKYPKNDSLIK